VYIPKNAALTQVAAPRPIPDQRKAGDERAETDGVTISGIFMEAVEILDYARSWESLRLSEMRVPAVPSCYHPVKNSNSGSLCTLDAPNTLTALEFRRFQPIYLVWIPAWFPGLV
jgi:hypothetical protein